MVTEHFGVDAKTTAVVHDQAANMRKAMAILRDSDGDFDSESGASHDKVSTSLELLVCS